MPLFWTRGQIAAVPVHSAYLQLQVTKAPENTPAINGEIQSGLIAGSLYLAGEALRLNDELPD